MIYDRWYDPSDTDVIYHYCTPEAFIEIIRTRSIWSSASVGVTRSFKKSRKLWSPTPD
jgi:hypothetical protein